MRSKEEIIKILDEITQQYGGTDWTLIMFHFKKPNYMALSNFTEEASLTRFKGVLETMIG